ncbi:hypothetical protein HMPREF1548_02903 [Clostridium sp. KLE 1755]|nr:hypothetical protein HMPREF1548_02903 [Clostridium sp. KLE 1755]
MTSYTFSFAIKDRYLRKTNYMKMSGAFTMPQREATLHHSYES